MAEFVVNIDRALFALVNQTLAWPAFDGVFVVITHKFFYLGAGVLAAIYLPARYRRPGLYCVLAAAAAAALSDASAVRLLKPLFARARPPFALETVRLLLPHQAPSPSFPSAHAANAVAFAFVVFTEYKRVGAALFAVALVVSYSRVYVGVHYPLDVAGGAVWGIFVGICAVSGRFYLGAYARRWWYLARRRKKSRAP
ncbi:MAG: phosphatase PAP2 family protein [candidate division Zixibacteria bacterium]|nr:phosphatase PAP2 family protein [candidate division Zixibacteria bacterium]